MTQDQQAIREVIARWHSATGNGDVDAVLALMAEDVVFFVAGRPPMRGRSEFEKGLRQILKTHRIESSGDVQEVEVAGDLAYSIVNLNVKVVPLAGGSAMARSGNAMSILRKQATGNWIVIRDANLLPPPSN